MLAIGIMSGTSLDGVDVCVVDINKKEDYEYTIKAFASFPYKDEIVSKIKQVTNLETSNVQKICSLNFEISHIHVEAIKQLLLKTNFDKMIK